MPSDTSQNLTGLTAEERRIYARVSRRGFMGATAGATLAALAGREPPCARASACRHGFGATSLTPATPTPSIVLWMAGGMAQTETFDPEALHAVRSRRQHQGRAQHVPDDRHRGRQHQVHRRASSRSRSVIDRGTVIRTFNAADLGFILHSRHQYHWHTGYIPPQPMAMPHLGAVISRTLGPKNPDVPAFIAIGQTVEGAGEIGTLKAFHTAGFLGSEHGPFLIVDPQDAASAVRPPKELGEERFRSRRQLFEKLLAQEPVHQYGERLPARVAGQVARRRRSAADVAVGQGVRPLARARRRSTPTTPAGSARAACSPGGSSKPARGTSR